VSPLIELLETTCLGEGPGVQGRYDERRGLRVDAGGRPVVEVLGPAMAGTETRGGVDRDEAAATIGSLGTVTKQERDRDEPRGLLLTKTSGGRDTDDDRLERALLGTVTFSGPYRD